MCSKLKKSPLAGEAGLGCCYKFCFHLLFLENCYYYNYIDITHCENRPKALHPLPPYCP